MNRAAHRLPIMVLWIASVAGAAPADPWLRIQSANFELFTTSGERAGRELVQHFEQVRGFFLQVFGLKSTNGKPVRIIAFHSEKEFQPYRPNQVATAFYHPGGEHDYILMSSADPENYPVATHEYTHLLIGQMDGFVPLWLNEGLAELYSTVQQMGPQVVIGLAPAGRPQSLREDRWIDLDALLATKGDSPLYNEKSRASMFYAESWALVHMLNLDNGYRQHLAAMLDALKTVDSAQAFQKAYGKSLPQVQADLRAYIGGTSLRGLAIQVPLPKEAESPEIEPHSALGARLALAELDTDYPGKLAEAAAAYTRLAHDFPQRWEVEAAWGRFAWRERHNQEAAGHLARAAELGATDPRLFLDYSRALAVTNHADQAIAALRSGLKLDGAFKDGHFELGLLLERSGEWREAIAELPQARPLKAQQASRFFYAMAYAEYKLGDAIAARNYVEQGRPYIKIPEEIAQLERLSQALGPPVVEGVIESIECRDKVASLHVRVENSPRTFLIPDLAPTGLECGPQKDLPFRIEYQAMPLGATGADGIVRSLLLR
jgi:Flp pilus assembly protein TadD